MAKAKVKKSKVSKTRLSKSKITKKSIKSKAKKSSKKRYMRSAPGLKTLPMTEQLKVTPEFKELSISKTLTENAALTTAAYARKNNFGVTNYTDKEGTPHTVISMLTEKDPAARAEKVANAINVLSKAGLEVSSVTYSQQKGSVEIYGMQEKAPMKEDPLIKTVAPRASESSKATAAESNEGISVSIPKAKITLKKATKEHERANEIDEDSP